MPESSQALLWAGLALVLVLGGYALARTRARWLPWLRRALAAAQRALLDTRARLRRGPPAAARAPLVLAPSRGEDARERSTCAHPIVLAHGFMAVDAVFALPGLRQEYFRGVREQLEAHGHCVYVPRVSPFASIKRRAEQLAEQLEKIDAEKVNIVAHSMGGLDARYAISRLGMAERVASLTTIGTPHRGTPLADATAIVRELPLLQRALRAQFGLDFEGFRDLTTAQMAAFNDAVPDQPGVLYSSYVGWVRGGVHDVHRLLGPGLSYLDRRAGQNDGMVPAASQRWGSIAGEVNADHWAQIGWSRGLDAKTFYAAIARLLARSGL